jgi:hypothetical protein
MEDLRPGLWLLVAFALCLLVLGGSTVSLTYLAVWLRAGSLTISGIGIFQDYYEHNQLKSYSSSTVAWIPSVESFMMFFWVCPGPVILGIFYSDQWLGSCGWQNDRRVRPAYTYFNRLIPSRLWSDDDIDIQRVLPDPLVSELLQCDRMFVPLLRP